MCSLLATAAALLLSAAGPEAPTRTPGAVEFPGVRIFAAEKRIECDAAFDIVDGSVFLEYLAVAPHGKLHESLFEIRCPAEKLQLGLIICGLEPKPEVLYQGEPRELHGPRVAIDAEWGEGDARRRMRVEDLLDDVRLGREMERTGFAFTGSRFLKVPARAGRAPADAGTGDDPQPREAFAAASSGSVIAVYHDPDAILDNPLVTGGDVPFIVPTLRLVEVVGFLQGDERLKPAARKLPARGTKAILHFRAQP